MVGPVPDSPLDHTAAGLLLQARAAGSCSLACYVRTPGMVIAAAGPQHKSVAEKLGQRLLGSQGFAGPSSTPFHIALFARVFPPQAAVPAHDPRRVHLHPLRLETRAQVTTVGNPSAGPL